MENLNYKIKNIERKYLSYMQKDQFLKVKKSLLEIEKKNIKLKYRKLKIKREIKELFFKPIIVLIWTSLKKRK